MGDLLMSSPAIHALKETFHARITVLTSSMAAGIAKYIPCIDDVIVSDIPWVKINHNEGPAGCIQLVETLRRRKFDSAVIFTVYSQNPLPSVMLAYLAGIPYRLAYCRENPYDLLTHWIPDQEPYSIVRHQVERDVQLVNSVGARTHNMQLKLTVPNESYGRTMHKLTASRLNLQQPWIIVHPGASEPKRLYPSEAFNNILKKIVSHDIQIVLTGTEKEKLLTEHLRTDICHRSFSVAGQLNLEEFMAIIDIAPLVLSVNTATVHIASALHTPVVVLYALTNPQHTPWNVPCKVFTYPVYDELKSRNEVIRYVNDHVMEKRNDYPTSDDVCESVMALMRSVHQQQH
jgi:lipopolysaccharide heptosyltransferase II